MPDIGLSFSPTSAPGQYGGAQGARGGSPTSPVMDAIKILSFRVPQVLGPNAPVASGVLAGSGGNFGSGLGNSAAIENFLRTLFGFNPLGNGSGTPPPFQAAPASGGPFGGPINNGPVGLPTAPPRTSIALAQRPFDLTPIDPGASASPLTWGSVGGVNRSMGPSMPIPNQAGSVNGQGDPSAAFSPSLLTEFSGLGGQ